MVKIEQGLDVHLWQDKLQNISNDFINAYSQLSANQLGYILDATEAEGFTRKRTEDSLPSFLPLRKTQIRKLLAVSKNLGILLSPLGLMTFTSAEFNNLRLGINNGGRALDVGGEYIHASMFKNGELARVGMWMVQSPSASDYTGEEFRRQSIEIDKNHPRTPSPDGVIRGRPAPKIPKKLFTPQKPDIKKMDEYRAHEAFHGIHFPLRDDLIDMKAFDRKLLSELLAYRTSLILATRSPDEIKNILITSYFRDLSSDDAEQVDRAIDIVSKSSDPNYQKEITWRGIGSTSVADFLNFPNELKYFAQEMVDFSTNEVLPSFESKLMSI